MTSDDRAKRAAPPTIIFINRFFYPDHSATAQMLADLAFELARRGLAIKVITSRLTYDATATRLPRRETVRGVEVVRIATTGFGRDRLGGRALDYVTFYLSLIVAVLREARSGDIVVAKTDPPLLSVVAGPVARLKGAHVVTWLQDVFPEVATALGLGHSSLTRLGMKVLRHVRDRALRRGSLTVTIGERMAAKVRASGCDPTRIEVIHNWADGELVRPVAPADNGLRREWGLIEAVVVGYSGNLGRAHDIDTLVEAMRLLDQRAAGRSAHDQASPPVEWLFIGAGALQERLRRDASAHRLESVQFRPYQPRDRLAESLSVPDIHLVSLRPALEGLIVPSKYYGIAAAGRPAIFIGAPDGEIATILTESGTGLVVPEADGAALAAAIAGLAAQPERRRAMGHAARALFERRFTLTRAVDQWEHALKRNFNLRPIEREAIERV